MVSDMRNLVGFLKKFKVSLKFHLKFCELQRRVATESMMTAELIVFLFICPVSVAYPLEY